MVNDSVLAKYHKKQYQSKYQSFLEQNSITLLINDKSTFSTDVNLRNFTREKLRPIIITRPCQLESLNKGVFISVIEHDEKLKTRIEKMGKGHLKGILVPTLDIGGLVEVLKSCKDGLNEKQFELFALYLNLSHSGALSKELLQILDKDSPSELTDKGRVINYDTLLKKAIMSHQNENESNQTESKALEALKLLGETGFLNVGVSEKSISFIKGSKIH